MISLSAQTELKLYYRDNCKQSIIQLEFELLDLDSIELPEIKSKNGIAIVTKPGSYLATSNWMAGDLASNLVDIVEINEMPLQIDTLQIPKIKFAYESVLHSQYWDYFNCDKLCDGLEIDYYPNGNKRLEGDFKNGKPIHIIEYLENGIKEIENFYTLGTSQPKRINHFDSNGNLRMYELINDKKNKRIIKIFDYTGKRTSRFVIKNQSE